ncbi:MAG: PorT family protein [Gemmatimonadaceae bacterium]|nr:PorT family protein [Gemmatimonadaceae bacterium]
MQSSTTMSRVIAAGVAALIAVPSYAQSLRTPVGVAQVGLEGGVSIANFTGDDANDAKNRTGGYGGVSFIVQPAGSAIGMQTGVNYVMKGAKSSFSSGGALPTVTGGVKLGYVEVPLLVRVGVPLSVAGVAPTLIAGGSFNWRVSCSAVAESGSFSSSTDCDNALVGQDLDVKRFDAGLTVGVELPIKAGARYLVVPSVRYIRGMTNITDANGTDLKNSSINIGIGLRVR